MPLFRQIGRTQRPAAVTVPPARRATIGL